MIKIAVCDDEINILNELGNKINALFSKDNSVAEVYKTDSPFELLEHLKNNAVDVLFLDIDMPVLSGMDIAEYILNADLKTLLIFVTSHDSLVYGSFKYHPFGFIRKSYFDEEISSVVESIIEELHKRSYVFTFKTAEGFFRIDLSDILYFESASNYINLHTAGKNYRFRGTLSAIEQELSAKGFVRTHKGFLVNQQHIFAIKGDEIQLSNEQLLPIGRTNKESVKRIIMRYMR